MSFRRGAIAFLAALALVPAAAQVPVKSQALDRPLNPAFEAALAEQRPGPAVSRIGALSDYLPSLAGTALDSPVYFIEPSGAEPRGFGTMIVPPSSSLAAPTATS